MKNIKKIFTMVAIVIGLLTFVVGCGKNKKDDEKTLRIGYFPNITHSQALVMKNQGSLEKKWGDSVQVTWNHFNAGPEEIEAMLAGEIDIGFIGPVPALNANVKSSGNIVIISNATDAGAVLVARKESGIKSIQELSGKKIAVPQLGNTQHLCLLNIMENYGLKEVGNGGDVTVIGSANADIVNLLERGDIDAALVPEPWASTMEKQMDVEILLDYDEVFLNGNYPTTVVIVNKDYMEKNPQIVKDFLEEHGDITEYINENKEAAQKMVNDEIEKVTSKKIEDEVISNAFSRMTISTEINQDAIMKFAEISKENGFIEIIPEVENVFVYKFDK